jgi:hypothetical protein
VQKLKRFFDAADFIVWRLFFLVSGIVMLWRLLH